MARKGRHDPRTFPTKSRRTIQRQGTNTGWWHERQRHFRLSQYPGIFSIKTVDRFFVATAKSKWKETVDFPCVTPSAPAIRISALPVLVPLVSNALSHHFLSAHSAMYPRRALKLVIPLWLPSSLGAICTSSKCLCLNTCSFSTGFVGNIQPPV